MVIERLEKSKVCAVSRDIVKRWCQALCVMVTPPGREVKILVEVSVHFSNFSRPNERDRAK